MDKDEDLVVSAKATLSGIRASISGNPTQWRNYTDSVRTCVCNIDTSRVMLDNSRLDERLWLINEVQNFAYFDADSGATTELASWCEREWNRVLSSDHTSIEAFKGAIPSTPSTPSVYTQGFQHEFYEVLTTN